MKFFMILRILEARKEYKKIMLEKEMLLAENKMVSMKHKMLKEMLMKEMCPTCTEEDNLRLENALLKIKVSFTPLIYMT